MHFPGILEEESKSYTVIKRNPEQMLPNDYSAKRAHHCFLRTAVFAVSPSVKSIIGVLQLKKNNCMDCTLNNETHLNLTS